MGSPETSGFWRGIGAEPQERAFYDTSTAEIRRRGRRARLDYRGRQGVVYRPAQPLRRCARAGRGSGHYHFSAQQPRHSSHSGRTSVEFLGYARQVVQQAALIEDEFIAHSASRQRFSVSTQHYSFTSSAFVELVRAQGGQSYEFILREGKTYDTIMDVRHLRSEMGVIYLCSFNEAVIKKTLRESNLVFSELFSARPHIFIGRNNPLAGRRTRQYEGFGISALPDL